MLKYVWPPAAAARTHDQYFIPGTRWWQGSTFVH